jgi:hypothetical protein
MRHFRNAQQHSIRNHVAWKELFDVGLKYISEQGCPVHPPGGRWELLPNQGWKRGCFFLPQCYKEISTSTV